MRGVFFARKSSGDTTVDLKMNGTRRRIVVLMAAGLMTCSLLADGAWARNCTPATIELGTQAELDSFQGRHGPCDRVIGDLRIVGEAIESIQGLSGIVRVEGGLLVENTEHLGNLKGLDGLEFVGGNLTIFHNFALESLDGLEDLRSVGGDLAVFANPRQRDVDALAALSEVGGFLGVTDLHSLQQIEGLVSLEQVGSHLLVVFNDGLQTLDGLNALKRVGGHVRVLLNPMLHSCVALAPLLGEAGERESGRGFAAASGVEGIAEFRDNLPGCNSLEQIRTSSSLSIDGRLSGAWHVPGVPGQGLFITVWPGSRRLFAGWSTFDVMRPPEGVDAILGDPGHRWLTAFGEYSRNRAQLQIYSTVGGVFEPSGGSPLSGVVGTALLEFSDPAAAALSFELPGSELGGVISLRRIHGTTASDKLMPFHP